MKKRQQTKRFNELRRTRKRATIRVLHAKVNRGETSSRSNSYTQRFTFSTILQWAKISLQYNNRFGRIGTNERNERTQISKMRTEKVYLCLCVCEREMAQNNRIANYVFAFLRNDFGLRNCAPNGLIFPYCWCYCCCHCCCLQRTHS